MSFTLNPSITGLLNEAQATAVASLVGLPATKQNLELLGQAIYSTVMRQVAAGLWAPHGIRDVLQLAGLRVRADFGNMLLGQPPIRAKYDFTETDLRGLVVDSVRPS